MCGSGWRHAARFMTIHIRAMIEPQMTTDQLNEAKRLVEAWQPRKAEELKMLEIALPAAPGAPARLCPAMP
jgi:hypothetical protein